MEVTWLMQCEFIFRILLAGICGLVIGVERKNRAKEAGIRTHFVVASGAAIMMIVSKYAFFDVITQGMFEGIEVRLDPSRVASTIASGIGFLGAGMIFVHKNTISGLTTAAGIWAISGVGMAIGSGLYVIGIVATIIILIAQIVLHMNLKWNAVHKTKLLVVKKVDMQNYQTYLQKKLKEIKVNVHDVSIDKDASSGTSRYIFTIEFPQSVKEDEILAMVEYDASLRASS